MTWSPGATLVTPSPTLSTTPAASWPRMLRQGGQGEEGWAGGWVAMGVGGGGGQSGDEVGAGSTASNGRKLVHFRHFRHTMPSSRTGGTHARSTSCQAAHQAHTVCKLPSWHALPSCAVPHQGKSPSGSFPSRV
jgi:hypothetical protein